MKVVAAIPLHYGRSYLKEAVEAVAPFADRIIVLYTPTPSYGHRTAMKCPDSEEELRACCDGVASKLTWHRGSWGSEGAHRNTVFDLAPDADLILPVDADEIWDAEALERCIGEAMESPARNFLATGFIHFFRSFTYACGDVHGPVRLIRPRGTGDQYIHGRVFHLGYADTIEATRYKWSGLHGHQAELRPEWMNDIFLANRREDCHPVIRGGWWNALPFKAEDLHPALRAHPNFGKEVIQ